MQVLVFNLVVRSDGHFGQERRKFGQEFEKKKNQRWKGRGTKATWTGLCHVTGPVSPGQIRKVK